MSVKIALAGNPNCGKTTLFNDLTGSNQYVGNWPGVTVEKKEGKLKGHKDVEIMDLPGIYSLSPYTLEEVVSRKYLVNERPDAILNIVDGTNIERNLYLTTQLLELGIPVVVAVNMMDLVEKSGDSVNTKELEKALGCKVVTISALKGTGTIEAALVCAGEAQTAHVQMHIHRFDANVEDYLSEIEERITDSFIEEEQKRFFAIKLFEQDNKINEFGKTLPDVKDIVKRAEKEMDDDTESIITGERYNYIGSVIGKCYKKAVGKKLTLSDKIDRIVTNRILALPIFAAVMFIVYYVSVTTVGTWATDWTNDGLFGDGFHLFGINGDYDDETDAWAEEYVFTDKLSAIIEDARNADVAGYEDVAGAVADGDFGGFEEAFGTYGDAFLEKGFNLEEGFAGGALDEEGDFTAPKPSDYGVWIPSIPVLVSRGLEAVNCADWLQGLIVEGIIAGVGAVLGFVPQILVLFIFLAFLEGCGYMARVAFIMDRIFRRFGLSGKSFIPMLIGTGCGVPGIMASRTIENDRDRKMTIMTTTFIPCGAKLPIIALIASALFNNAWWVAPSAYFIGIGAVVISGIILKKTKMFAGEPAPFVMELPAYHLPTVGNVLRSMWERGWSFIKRAGSVILISSIIIWAGSCFGVVDGKFIFSGDMELTDSILGHIGNGLKWIFAPLGFGSGDEGIMATIATIMGLVAKEEVVGVFGVLDFEGMAQLAAYSFLIFNLLCAPCFAAMGAIKREMNNGRWFAFAIGYQTLLGYVAGLVVYQLGSLFVSSIEVSVIGVIVALLLVAVIVYLMVRPAKREVRVSSKASIQA